MAQIEQTSYVKKIISTTVEAAAVVLANLASGGTVNAIQPIDGDIIGEVPHSTKFPDSTEAKRPEASTTALPVVNELPGL